MKTPRHCPLNPPLKLQGPKNDDWEPQEQVNKDSASCDENAHDSSQIRFSKNFSNFFLAVQMNPGALSKLRNHFKRCFATSKALKTDCRGCQTKIQKSSFLTPKKLVKGIFFLATDRSSGAEIKTEFSSRCVLRVVDTQSGPRWPVAA